MNTNEEKIFDNILETYVVPALTDDKLNASESAYDDRLVEINRNINQQRFRGPANIQQRMIPVEQRRETHHDLLDSYAGIKEAQ